MTRHDDIADLKAAHLAAQTVAAAQVPTDAVVYEWDNLPSAAWTRDYNLCLTGRSARFEVVSSASQFAAWWRRPEPGAIIVRILKNDGTPGLQFEEWPLRWQTARWELRDWQPGDPGLAPATKGGCTP